MTRHVARAEGFALVVVLWSVALLALLVATLTAAQRADLRATDNLRRAALLETAADGAISRAVFALLEPNGRAFVDFTRRMDADGARITVTVASQAGLMNPNVVSPDMLRLLMDHLGAGDEAARRIAQAIVDWRTPGQTQHPGGAKAPQYRLAGLDYGPPGAPIESLGELRQVLGMTPALLAAMTPHMTVYWDGDPDPAFADPVVRLALRDAGVSATSQQGRRETEVVTVTARADTETGEGSVVRRAVIRLGFSPDGRGWRVLAWDSLRD